MTDDRRLAAWVESMARGEIRAYMRARRAFLKTASTRHLRELRGAARRLRSLFDDFGDLVPARRQKALARLLSTVAQATEIAGVRRILRKRADDRDEDLVTPMLRVLRQQERHWLRYAERAAAHLRYRA